MDPFERTGAVTAYSYATDPPKGEHFLPFTSETLRLSLRLNNNILCNQVPHFQINVGQAVGETGV